MTRLSEERAAILKRLLEEGTIDHSIFDLLQSADSIEQESEKGTVDFVTPLSDHAAILLLTEHEQTQEEAAETIKAWKQYALSQDYMGKVAWLVRAGFTLKKHASKAGPCFQNLGYLQNWLLQHEGATENALVCWVPRLVKDSEGKTIAQMTQMREELRNKHHLPYCDSFGSIDLLFAVILAYYKHVGGRVPFNFVHAVSDAFHADGDRLIVEGMAEQGLRCYCWNDCYGPSRFGFFLLGVKHLGA